MGSRARQLAVVVALFGLGTPPTSSADDTVPDPNSAAIRQYIEMVPSSTGDQPVTSAAPIATASLPQQAAEPDSTTSSAAPDKAKRPVRTTPDTPGGARSEEPNQMISSAPNSASLGDVGVNGEIFVVLALMVGTVALLIVSALRRRPR